MIYSKDEIIRIAYIEPIKEALCYNSLPKTKIANHYFKKQLGTSLLEKKEDISFIEITCFSLSQLKLLSMALEVMLSLLAYFDVSLSNILSINYFQIYAYIHYKVLH